MTSAIVVGGGLAGTATALALGRAGIGAEVFEEADSPAAGLGAWLTLASNGLDALDAIGMTEAVAAIGFPTPRMALRSGSGGKLVDFPAGVPRADGLQVLSARRADLYGVLREEVGRRGVPVHYGKRLVDAGQTDDGRVRARFADGTEATADLLVGADGLRSRTRTVIDPEAPRARYTGLLNTGGYARGVDVGTPPGEMNLCFGRRCFLGWVASPDGDVWWFANPPSPTELSKEELATWAGESGRRRLLDLFAEDDLPVRRLLDGTEEIFAGWHTYDFPSVPTWHRDGMVLVGDAVHAASPASGQGASMAFEDAVTLARCLRDRPPVEEAFAAYERIRRPRVEAVVAHGKRSGDSKAPGPVGRFLRDRVVLPLVAVRIRRAGTAPDEWLTGHHIDWADPVPA